MENPPYFHSTIICITSISSNHFMLFTLFILKMIWKNNASKKCGCEWRRMNMNIVSKQKHGKSTSAQKNVKPSRRTVAQLEACQKVHEPTHALYIEFRHHWVVISSTFIRLNRANECQTIKYSGVQWFFALFTLFRSLYVRKEHWRRLK